MSFLLQLCVYKSANWKRHFQIKKQFISEIEIKKCKVAIPSKKSSDNSKFVNVKFLYICEEVWLFNVTFHTIENFGPGFNPGHKNFIN